MQNDERDKLRSLVCLESDSVLYESKGKKFQQLASIDALEK